LIEARYGMAVESGNIGRQCTASLWIDCHTRQQGFWEVAVRCYAPKHLDGIRNVIENALAFVEEDGTGFRENHSSTRTLEEFCADT
jgi:hypothetical protein